MVISVTGSVDHAEGVRADLQDVAVRKRALARLVRISPPTSRIFSAMGKVVAGETSDALAASAAQTLKKYGSQARPAIGSLSRGLRSSSVAVRKRVLYALAAIGRAARKQIQRTAKRDQDPEIQKLATELLLTLK